MTYQLPERIRAYVAGPMRGYEHFNFEAFDFCAYVLRTWGWDVRSPAENDREGGFDETRNDLSGFSLTDAMRWDLESVCWANMVVLLPGWQNSTGVGVELIAARAVGNRIVTFDPNSKTVSELIEETPIQEADRIVDGARQADYGHPIDDFTRTGRMWGAIMGVSDIDPAVVSLCMLAVKMSREVNRPKRDNRVDMHGYTKTLEMVRERQAQG